MTIRVGINGFGRIGRNFLRAVQASDSDVEIVGVNDLAANDILAHFLRYDSILGRFPGAIESDENYLTVNGTKIAATGKRSRHPAWYFVNAAPASRSPNKRHRRTSRRSRARIQARKMGIAQNAST